MKPALPPSPFVVKEGEDHIGEYVETRCTESSWPVDDPDYKRITVGGWWDERMDKPRIWMRYYKK